MTFRKEGAGTPDSGAHVKQVLPEGGKGHEFRDTKSLRAHSSAVLGHTRLTLPLQRFVCIPWCALSQVPP